MQNQEKPLAQKRKLYRATATVSVYFVSDGKNIRAVASKEMDRSLLLTGPDPKDLVITEATDDATVSHDGWRLDDIPLGDNDEERTIYQWLHGK